MARLRVGTRQQRLRGRELGKLESKPITEDFASKVREDSISRLARMKKQTDKQKALETGAKVPQAAKPAQVAKPMPPKPKPAPPAPPPPPPKPAAPTLAPQQGPAPQQDLGGRGAGAPATGPEPSMSMADAVGRGGMSGLEAAGRGAMVLGSVIPNPVTGPVTPLSAVGLLKGAKQHGQAFEAAKAGKEAQAKMDTLSPMLANAPAAENPPQALAGLEAMHAPAAPPSISMSPIGSGVEAGGSLGGQAGAIGGMSGSSSAASGIGVGSSLGGQAGAIGGMSAPGGSAGGGVGVGGCIIISACTDPYSYEVNVTRVFRDTYLSDAMLKGYYALARRVVPSIRRFTLVRKAVKRLLVDRLIDYGEWILNLKPERERRGSEAVSLGFLRLIGWIGRHK